MISLSAFSNELLKISAAKKKLRKVSGEVMLDRSTFSQQLGEAAEAPKRGPHPALNYEHSR